MVPTTLPEFAFEHTYQAGFGASPTPISGSYFRTVNQDIAESRTLLDELFPGYPFGSGHTKPCLISMTASGLPYIDHLDEHTIIATEGERGVMAADEIGRLATGLAIDGRWTDSIPAQNFQISPAH
ncbi:hypothetical protein [Nocardia sp. NPDC051570]|uniref:hypothetical protein n=1 Tax=Nocardia sp. NPDC051570 TaxID=3364324 RepID=UPI00378CA35E